jgi:TipAS antibiotic-recognition protein
MSADGELQSGKQPSTCALKRIIEVIEMQSNPDWMMKYFSDEARAKVEARKASWTPDMQARAEQNWSDLFRDIRLALDKDPASMEAQSLVDRWNNLVRQFTGGEPGVVKGVKLLYSDRANWPAEFEEKMAPFSDERVWEFFRKAVAARRSG